MFSISYQYINDPRRNVEVTNFIDFEKNTLIKFPDSTSVENSLAVDKNDNIYLAISNDFNDVIYKISSSGVVTKLAGGNIKGLQNGNGPKVAFNRISGIAIDKLGNLYACDAHNRLIRKVTPSGTVSTWAGSGNEGSKDGQRLLASFTFPTSISIDDNNNLYIGDSGGNSIRKISSKGLVTTLASSGEQGSSNGRTTKASFDDYLHITVDKNGSVYVSEWNSDLIRKINKHGVVTTFAGTGYPEFADGLGTSASFFHPAGITSDANGFVYVSDMDNNKIRRISPDGIVTTLAGTGDYSSNNGNGLNASFLLPSSVAVDSKGNLYVATERDILIRKISQRR